MTGMIIRSHNMGRYRWCAEQSRLAVAEGVHTEFQSGAMSRGIALHDWLDRRPRSKDELELEQALTGYAEERGWFDSSDVSKKEKSRYFLRDFNEHKVKAHPDNFRVFWSKGRKVAQIEEYKTTRNKSSLDNRYIQYQYEWQLRSYIYTMRPILEGLGYIFADQHPITYFQSDRGFYLGTHNVPAISDADFEIELAYVLEVWGGRIAPKLPAPFKCKTCPFAFKSRCKLRAAWLAGELKVPDFEARLWREPLPKGSMIEWEDEEFE